MEEAVIEKCMAMPWSEFDRAAANLAQQLKHHMEVTDTVFDGIHGIPRGGLCLAVRLSYLLEIPLVMNKEDVVASTLLVDNCTVSGKTLEENNLHGNTTAVIAFKPQSSVTPDFYHLKTDMTINFCWEGMADRN
jgi:hypoxanthine phosphoribosyltransferase